MKAIASHFGHHHLHLAACGAAALFVVVAVAFEVPIFAVLGAVFCAAMMLSMVWMMIAMAKSHH